MAKQRKTLYLATVVLLVLIVGICVLQARQDAGPPVSVVLNTQAGPRNIRLWDGGDRNYYVFLPGYGDMRQTRVELHTDEEVRVNGTKLSDGMSCGEIDLDVAYDFSWEAWGSPVHGRIRFVRSANVAAMFIDTGTGSMDYIHEKKGNSESGTLALYFPDGTMSYSGKLASIQGRGNNTWEEFEKKPYSLRLSEAADLLKMGSAEKWILLANADDPSHLRNKLAFGLAEQMGLPYSPDAHWVDLYLNGEYAGLYLLSERNEVHPERVDISGDTGVLLSLENEKMLASKNVPYVKTAEDQTLRVHYPEPVSDSRLDTIRKAVQSVENALLDGWDPTTGKELQDLIDMDSWVRSFVLDELLGNLDGFWASRFLYYETMDGKLMAGPVWDYDKAIGNDHSPDWSIPNGNAMVLTRYTQRNIKNAYWANLLYARPEFREGLAACYEEVRPLLDQWMLPQIDIYAEQIREAARLNDIRWNCYPEGTTYDAEVAEIGTYLRQHGQFLTDVWLDGKDMCQVSIVGGGFYYFYALPRGEALPELPAVPQMENMEFLGWFDAFNGKPFDPSQPITEDTSLYGAWQDTKILPDKAPELIAPALLLVVLAVVFRREILNWKSCHRKK